MSWRKYFRKQKKRAVSWAKKRYTGRGAIKNIVKDVSMLKTMINAEYKYNDVTVNGSPTQGVPNIIGLNQISTGNTSTTRTGNSLKMTSVQAWLQIERNPTTASPDANYVRVSLVLDKEPLLGTPVVTDIWNTSAPSAFRNFEYEHTGRFKVLASREFVIDGVQTKSKVMKLYKKLNVHSRYNSTTSTSCSNNALYLIIQTDNSVSLDVSAIGGTRVRYIDN